MTTNNRSISLAAVILAGTTLLLPTRAEATLSQTATFDEKVTNAASIVVGKVVRSESRFDPTHKFILTYTTVRVDKTLKGFAGGEVTVVTPGGHVGDVYQETIGSPEFKYGQETALFVKNTRVGPTVLYLDQGAYDVTRDSHGEAIVNPVETDAVHLDAQRGIASAIEEPRSLREFEAAVKTSSRRAVQQQMAMVNQKKQQNTARPSIWTDIAENAWIIAIAVLGAILASIPLLRRQS